MFRKTKYNNTRIKGGFRSKLEKKVSMELRRVNKGRYKVAYEKEQLHYVLPKRYLPDFVLHMKDGRKIYIEAKGFFRQEDRQKMAAVKKSNPHLDIRLIFGKPRESDIDWCNKHGFKWAAVAIPKDWFE